jgi:hypothetical protein
VQKRTACHHHLQYALTAGCVGPISGFTCLGSKGSERPSSASIPRRQRGLASLWHQSAGTSKTNRFLVQIITEWYLKQIEALQTPAGEKRHPSALLDLRMPPPLSPFEARLHRAREQMRELLEAGEIDWQQLHDESVLAFTCEDEEAETSSRPERALAA